MDDPQPNASPSNSQEQLQAQITELKSRLDAGAEINKQAFAALEERLKLRDEVIKLREEVDQKVLLFKWSASAAALVLGLAGFLGYKKITDYTDLIKDEMLAKLNHVSSYYGEFSSAVAQLNAGETKESLSHFRKAFDQEGGHYDEGLLAVYLHALDEADDWEQGKQVIDIVKADRNKYDAFKSPWLWSNLAALQIQIGPDNADSLNEGRESLRKFEQFSDPNDAEALGSQYVQHWMLALVDRDPTAAR